MHEFKIEIFIHSLGLNVKSKPKLFVSFKFNVYKH
jgi:hypothetical protein